jgi:hypothetical protein
MANPNFNTLASTTLQKYLPKMGDSIFQRYALLNFFTKKARKYKVNGRSFVVPLMHELNDTFVTYAGYDHLDLTPQEASTAAEYQWKNAAISVAVSGEEEAWNSGREAVLSLLQAKITQAEKSAADNFNRMFFTSDGTGNGGKDWLGLAVLVDSTGTVGGINSTLAENAFWRSFEDATATSLTIHDIHNGHLQCTAGGTSDRPDFEITTLDLFLSYNDQLQIQQRYENADMAQAGFMSLRSPGGSPVTWDNDCPSGHWFFLNSDHIFLVSGEGQWMRQRSFIQPEDQDARYALILSKGQLVTDERRKLGKLTNRTA